MEDFIRFENKNLHYKTEGTGNALVLLHGFTESLDIWNEFSKELSNTLQVVSVDLPGHGKSECIGESHTMELMAECIHAVLEHLKIKECVMIGHSMGGYVTLAFAEKYPAMIKGLGLFHSSALPDTPEGKANRSKVVEFIRNNHTEFIMNFIPDLFAEENRKKFKSEISVLVEAAKEMTREGIIASQLGMRERPDRTHILKEATYPILFIAGKKDTRVLFEKVLEQIAMPKDAVALLLENIAHMGYIEAKAKTMHAVKCYVETAF
jgi:pimeloyl-ACP methyl ester carboxylesterase